MPLAIVIGSEGFGMSRLVRENVISSFIYQCVEKLHHLMHLLQLVCYFMKFIGNVSLWRNKDGTNSAC